MDNLGKNWQLIKLYFVDINDDPLSTKNACRNLYSPGHRCPSKKIAIYQRFELKALFKK
jgi:hypothetical protein